MVRKIFSKKLGKILPNILPIFPHHIIKPLINPSKNTSKTFTNIY